MVRFQKTELKEQFESGHLHPLVVFMVYAAAGYAQHLSGRALWVTSVYREGDPGVHGVWRGTDADNDFMSKEHKEEIARFLNERFVYDPERPDMVVCLYHQVAGRGGDHLHIQVHPRTVLR
jgi:hypothetical protein